MYFSHTLMNMSDDYLTVSEAAKILGRQPDSVRKSIRSGFIKAIRRGHMYFIHPDDLKAYQENPPQVGQKSGAKHPVRFRVFELETPPHTRVIIKRFTKVPGHRVVFGPDTEEACKAFLEESQVAE